MELMELLAEARIEVEKLQEELSAFKASSD